MKKLLGCIVLLYAPFVFSKDGVFKVTNETACRGWEITVKPAQGEEYMTEVGAYKTETINLNESTGPFHVSIVHEELKVEADQPSLEGATLAISVARPIKQGVCPSADNIEIYFLSTEDLKKSHRKRAGRYKPVKGVVRFAEKPEVRELETEASSPAEPIFEVPEEHEGFERFSLEELESE